jgi:hypothetical protein
MVGYTTFQQLNFSPKSGWEFIAPLTYYVSLLNIHDFLEFLFYFCIFLFLISEALTHFVFWAFSLEVNILQNAYMAELS